MIWDLDVVTAIAVRLQTILFMGYCKIWRMMNLCKFDEDYYINGVKKQISGYENFHYIPTRSFSEAIEIVNRFKFNTVIDYGCAFGFLVHALRQLGKKAYGEDISDYALVHCLEDVRKYLSKPNDMKADFLIGKDILEHIPEEEMKEMLMFLRNKANQFLFVIPLGDNDTFRIREYSIDKTHVTRKDEDWWINIFRETGYNLKSFDYSMGRIKEKWTSVDPFGNGFFVLEKR